MPRYRCPVCAPAKWKKRRSQRPPMRYKSIRARLCKWCEHVICRGRRAPR